MCRSESCCHVTTGSVDVETPMKGTLLFFAAAGVVTLAAELVASWLWILAAVLLVAGIAEETIRWMHRRTVSCWEGNAPAPEALLAWRPRRIRAPVPAGAHEWDQPAPQPAIGPAARLAIVPAPPRCFLCGNGPEGVICGTCWEHIREWAAGELPDMVLPTVAAQVPPPRKERRGGRG